MAYMVSNANASQPLKNNMKQPSTFFHFLQKERQFLMIVLFLFFIAFVTYPMPSIARWVGFIVAGYAAVANDSIQTIGTFIASNRQRPWWLLWLFIGGIFVATMTYSWFSYTGDVSYGRLASKGFSETPNDLFLSTGSSPHLLAYINSSQNASIHDISYTDSIFDQCKKCCKGIAEKFNRVFFGLWHCHYYLVIGIKIN